MRRVFLLPLAMLAMGGNVMSQSLVTEDGEFFVVSSNVTANGKPVLGICENRGPLSVVSLYDGAMNVSRSISVEQESVQEKYWTETSDTLKPVGIRAGETYVRPGFGEVWLPETINLAEVTTPDSLAALVQSYFGGTFVGYYDTAGRMSCCQYSDSWCFWKYELYGKQYPYHYRCVIDGKLWDYIQPYEYEYDTSNISWTVSESDWHSEKDIYGDIEPVFLMDYDSNALPSNTGLYVSQTLFNSDDSWEYVIPSLVVRQNYEEPVTALCDDGVNVIMTRVGHSYARCTGYRIVSENGKEIAQVGDGHDAVEMRLENVFKIGGDVFFETDELVADSEGGTVRYRTLYRYDMSAAAVRAVSRARSGECSAAAAAGVVTVTVSEDMTDSDVSIADMSGRTVADCHLAPHRTSVSFSAAQLPGGTYSVSVKRGGTLLGGCKLLIGM